MKFHDDAIGHKTIFGSPQGLTLNGSKGLYKCMVYIHRPLLDLLSSFADDLKHNNAEKKTIVGVMTKQTSRQKTPFQDRAKLSININQLARLMRLLSLLDQNVEIARHFTHALENTVVRSDEIPW